MLIDPSRIRVLGPLAPFASGFAEELNRQVLHAVFRPQTDVAAGAPKPMARV